MWPFHRAVCSADSGESLPPYRGCMCSALWSMQKDKSLPKDDRRYHLALMAHWRKISKNFHTNEKHTSVVGELKYWIFFSIVKPAWAHSNQYPLIVKLKTEYVWYERNILAFAQKAKRLNCACFCVVCYKDWKQLGVNANSKKNCIVQAQISMLITQMIKYLLVFLNKPNVLQKM